MDVLVVYRALYTKAVGSTSSKGVIVVAVVCHALINEY